MLASQSAVALTGSRVATEADVRTDARLAGAGLLVALGSIVVLYGGSSVVAGTRPDNAAIASAVIEFFAHPTLAIVFSQAVFSVFGLTFFALAFRRYLRARTPSAVTAQIIDFGTGVLVSETAVLSFGALRSGGLPRWLAVLGLIIAALLATLAAPALLLGYRLGINLGAYAPFMVWMLLTGVYLARGGARPTPSST